jgi:hypothetical protein
VLIHVVQGERELAKDCRSLARFDLKNIDPMPAGMARIEVRFLIDANGILNVTARDLRTGKEQSVDVNLPTVSPTPKSRAWSANRLNWPRRFQGAAGARGSGGSRCHPHCGREGEQSEAYARVERRGAQSDRPGREPAADGCTTAKTICSSVLRSTR